MKKQRKQNPRMIIRFRRDLDTLHWTNAFPLCNRVRRTDDANAATHGVAALIFSLSRRFAILKTRSRLDVSSVVADMIRQISPLRLRRATSEVAFDDGSTFRNPLASFHQHGPEPEGGNQRRALKSAAPALPDVPPC